MRQKEMRGLLFFALGQQTGALQSRAQGQIQDDHADGGGYAVDKGDTTGDLGQGLCHGILLAKDVNVAEIAQELSLIHI